MKRLLLAALFGVSYAFHDWSHGLVSGPQHEACAVSASAVDAPAAAPQVAGAPLVSGPVFVSLPSLVSAAPVRRASARAPPASVRA